MNALLSYIRHLITYGVTKLFVMLNLPQEGMSEATLYIAEAFVIALSWVVVKYGGTWLRKIGLLKGGAASLLLLSLMSGLLFTSCTSFNLPKGVKGSLYYRDKDSGAKAGVEVIDGKLSPWARVPFVDENGNVVGEFEVTNVNPSK